MFPDAAPSDPQGMRYLGEPHVVEVADGHLLGMARHEEQPYVEGRETGRLWQFESLDGGIAGASRARRRYSGNRRIF